MKFQLTASEALRLSKPSSLEKILREIEYVATNYGNTLLAQGWLSEANIEALRQLGYKVSFEEEPRFLRGWVISWGQEG